MTPFSDQLRTLGHITGKSRLDWRGPAPAAIMPRHAASDHAKPTRRIAALGRRLSLAAVILGVALAPPGAAAGVPTTPSDANPGDGVLKLDQYRGKVVYLDFWASWCGPCKLSFPFMNKLRARYPQNALVILTVNLDRQKSAAQYFIDQTGTRLPVIFDPAGKIAAQFMVSSMPTSLVIGRDGKVRYVHQGFEGGKTTEYQNHVASALEQGS